MKKRIIFDLVAFLAIAASFFMLLYFQDFDMEILGDIKGVEGNMMVDKPSVFNAGTSQNQAYEEGVLETLDKQNFIQPSAEEFVNCYYYSALNEDEKKVYEEIYSSLKNRDEARELSTVDTQLVEKIFKCVLNDHPKFYYVEGYSYMTYTRKDKIVKLEMVGTYSKTEEECEVLDVQIENAVNKCFSGMKSGLSDYEKVKYIYEYIIDTTEYKLESQDNQNICSVFLNGESVCMGYAKTMQYLLLKQNIFCTLVNGTALHGEEHAWNLILLDGQYYHVDVTWGDSSYMVTNGEDFFSETPNYGFFCVPTEEISKTHTIKSVVELPQCIAWESNYYIKEGLYFKSLDTEKIAQVFGRAYETGENHLEIKCQDVVVFREIYGYLIEEQNVFQYLNDEKDTVSYYEDEELLMLEFWLK